MAVKRSVYPVIMAGGSGTRFWPKSTARRPKQLLSFAPGAPSLIQLTARRLEQIAPPENISVVTTELLATEIAAQLPRRVRILAEPQGRNTAPCVYWAAREIAELTQNDPNAVMLVLPADHFIADDVAFTEALQRAVDWAATHDDLVTLGVAPTRPETGYGYLRTGNKLSDHGALSALKVDAFVEKPNAARAQEFIQSGNYLWNGGMFAWRVSTILKAFDQAMPEMRREWDGADGDVLPAYPRLTATSIDFGVMEKASNVVTFVLDCGWDDIGSWTALDTLGERLGILQAAGAVSAGRVVAIDSSDNIVDVPEGIVALLGARGLIIAQQGGRLLIADKSRAQDIKRIVDAVKAQYPDQA